jgi:hypothetical protein
VRECDRAHEVLHTGLRLERAPLCRDRVLGLPHQLDELGMHSGARCGARRRERWAMLRTRRRWRSTSVSGTALRCCLGTRAGMGGQASTLLGSGRSEFVTTISSTSVGRPADQAGSLSGDIARSRDSERADGTDGGRVTRGCGFHGLASQARSTSANECENAAPPAALPSLSSSEARSSQPSSRARDEQGRCCR